MKDEMQRRRGRYICVNIDAAHRRHVGSAEIFIGQECRGAMLIARQPAELKGVMARIITMREPLGVAKDGGWICHWII